MKKLMSILAAAMCAGTAVLAADYFPGTVTVEAGDTSAYTDLSLTKAIGGGGAAAIDRVVVGNTSGTGTGRVSFVSYDFGVETILADSTSTNVVPGSIFDNAPKRSVPITSSVGYAVVTGNVVVTGSTITTTTNKEPYTVRFLRVKVVQPASASDNVYSFGVFTK